MSDVKTPPGTAGDDHSQRVHSAFDDLHDTLGERSTPEARASVEKLRAAALARDGDGLRESLEDVKRRNSWLYQELARHPKVAALVNELALMGF